METAEEYLLEAMKHPALRICTGSRMYGTARIDEQGNIISDMDLRDILIPPFEYLTLIKGDFETRKGSIGDDHVVYSLSFFINKLIKGNPQMIEILFAQPDMILAQDRVGKELLSMRESFVSKQYYKSMLGFSYSEFRKTCGEKLIFEEHKPNEDQAWDVFRETFGPKWGNKRKEITDEIKALAYSCHPFKLIPSVDGISKKRRHEFQDFGYCSSSACHSLRILRQAAEFLRTGNIIFPRPDAEELRDIKLGKSTLEKFKVLYEEAKADAAAAFKESKLPDKCEEDKVQAWLNQKIINAIYTLPVSMRY